MDSPSGSIRSVEVEQTTEERALQLLVAVVAYNEVATISKVVNETKSIADKVVVIDDGSTDGTGHLAREVGATVIRHPTNQGYGAALKTAFSTAAQHEPDILVIIDGDGQHDPEGIKKLANAQQKTGADLLVGSRFLSEDASTIPLYRRLGLSIVNTATNLSLVIGTGQTPITDTQCGLRAYRPSLYQSLASDDDIGDGMEASTDILYHTAEHGYDIREVAVEVSYDSPSSSSKHPLVHGLRLSTNITSYVVRQYWFLFFVLAVSIIAELVRRKLSPRQL